MNPFDTHKQHDPILDELDRRYHLGAPAKALTNLDTETLRRLVNYTHSVILTHQVKGELAQRDRRAA